MGYWGRHLATITTAVFAAVLTGLWPWFNGWTPLLDFVFLMSVPITWFMALVCWLAQKSADYVHDHPVAHEPAPQAEPAQATPAELEAARAELDAELASVRDTVKIKDTEIERLKQEIASLQTRVQIESLKAELADLKMLASGR